jgi:hypothetical protein
MKFLHITAFALFLISASAIKESTKNTIKDWTATTAGMAVAPFYYGWKSIGIVYRCRKITDENVCENSDGCKWKGERCGASGLLGMRKYWSDRKTKCSQFDGNSEQCEAVRDCYYSERKSTCKARFLHAIRSTFKDFGGSSENQSNDETDGSSENQSYDDNDGTDGSSENQSNDETNGSENDGQPGDEAQQYAGEGETV